jgi:hypothetical protein
MMYDPLALDRQRQDQETLRRRAAHAPQQPARGPKPPREARRRHGLLRRLTTATSSS